MNAIDEYKTSVSKYEEKLGQKESEILKINDSINTLNYTSTLSVGIMNRIVKDICNVVKAFNDQK